MDTHQDEQMPAGDERAGAPALPAETVPRGAYHAPTLSVLRSSATRTGVAIPTEATTTFS